MKPDLAVIEKLISQPLIDQIEAILAEAKSGEINGWVCITSFNNNCTGSCWTGLEKNGRRIVGSLFCAATDIANQINKS